MELSKIKKYENDAKKAATSCGKCNSILDDSLVGYSLQICGVAGSAPIFVRLSTKIPRGLSFFTAFFRVVSPSFEVQLPTICFSTGWSGISFAVSTNICKIKI